MEKPWQTELRVDKCHCMVQSSVKGRSSQDVFALYRAHRRFGGDFRSVHVFEDCRAARRSGTLKSERKVVSECSGFLSSAELILLCLR